MRSTWPLPDNRLIEMREHQWLPMEVIIEFNGPQLEIVKSGNDEYLGVASDEEGDIVRWLRSKISATEKRSLLCGETTIRDCILKPEIWVVDTRSDGSVTLEAKVSPDQLSSADLPADDSFLPDDLIRAYISTPRHPGIAPRQPATDTHPPLAHR